MKQAEPSLTAAQLRVLAAICQVFNPPLPPPGPSRASVFRNQAADWPIVERLQHHFQRLSAEDWGLVRALLDRLEGWGRGGIRGGPLRPFSSLSLAAQTQVVQKLLRSRDLTERSIVRSLQRLTLHGSYLSERPARSPQFSRELVQGSASVTSSVNERSDETTAAHPETLNVWGYPYGNQQVAKPERLVPARLQPQQSQLACDYLVIGSGAGGSVMAAELAETGRKVLLVDSGELINRLEFGQSEAFAARHLYESWGAFDCGRSDVLVTAAKTWGGGPVVNWGTCWDPPPSLLQEWAEDYGFGGVLSREFQHSLFTVRRRLQVSRQSSQLNRQNELLRMGLEGCHFPVEHLERNAVDCGTCDRCEFGCASAARQDSRETYLLDAQRLGVYSLPNCKVESLEFSGDTALAARAVWRAAGEERELTIRFRHVVLAAGAVHSPAILLRSRAAHAHWGQHLHLQPAAVVWGWHPQAVRGWQGPVQTIASAALSNLDGRGYGVRWEVAPVHPGLAAMMIPWNTPAQHKHWMQHLDYLSTTLVLLRDRSEGSVTLDHRRHPQVYYRLAATDRQHLSEGVTGALAIQFAAGAQWVLPPRWSSPVWSAADWEWPPSKSTRQQLRGMWDRTHDWKLFSAHQFSTLRIADSATRGAADVQGRIFGTRNVFVADAAALPTATGVNPMLTIFAVSHFLAQQIKALTA